MALRKRVSDVFKLTNIFNSLAREKAVQPLPSALSVCKNAFHPESVENIEHQRLNRLLNKTCSISAVLFNTGVWRASERESVALEYKCPSGLKDRFSHLVILDKQTNKSDYHLPLRNPVISSVIDPTINGNSAEVTDPLPSQQVPLKEAKEILKIRHKKMKKHKLKKLRRRMYFLWRKQKMTRKAKRDAIYWKEIEEIKKEGEDFDAENFVKEQLQKARRGGYYINVFDSRP